ncbi:MAG TPA: class I SAM-dependent methyltransferase [Hellea balneolensis]|uniref:Class I SAM-dependent methyltransferase n=1 Tax=Hellea balneolensis TaxID=287478 RepID=A0A7C3GL31_9PROT|nr:class I SAM-dependent methyltransferase [Hellea balneolensis]
MRLLSTMMKRFVKTGTLTIIDAGGMPHTFGGEVEGPSATVKLHDKKLHRSLFLNPELKAGEAYMDGTLTVEEGTIRDFLHVFALNAANLRGQGHQKRVRAFYKRVKRFHQKNVKSSARKNVEHHYDLSNEFYALFLDDDMQYSCAYYERPDMSLEDAQLAKKRHIAAKMDLKPGQKILDIGCGWGGMALYLAENFDVHVTGVTLSNEQHALGNERIKQRGLEGKVDILLQDYRELDGPFDRIVSVGMFEHVGVPHYLEFFNKVSDLLADDGSMLLHSIGRRGGPGSTARWIRKYIFPGGYSPAISETMAEIEKSGMWVTDIEILRLHYAETCLEWDKRFQANRDKIATMMDERFCRMFEFYLIISEFSFRYSKNMNFQIQLTKRVDALPITRDYMHEAETALR